MVWTSEDGRVKYTHGPDCTKGPNCCCGACNFITLAIDCNNTVCCKCVPKELCVVHYPYEETDTCLPRNTLLTFVNSWQGSLAGIDPYGENNHIEVFMTKLNYEECNFVLFIPARDINVFFPIEGGKRQCAAYQDDRITCRNPRFVIEDFELNGCNGRLVIERKLLAPMPFHSTTEFGTLTDQYMPACGQCTQYCRVLCLEWSVGGAPQKSQFGIIESESSVYWTSLLADGSTATITAYEAIDGNCYFLIDHNGLGDFQEVMIPPDMCNLGMIIEEVGDYRWPNKSISLSCNRCTCWDYVCERCRCVCPTLCVVSVNGMEQSDIHYYELDWDPIALRWGNDEKWASVRANPTTGKCEFVISGWNDGPYPQYEPSESIIEIEECGGDMYYYVTSDIEEAYETGVFKFEYASCKTCDPNCFRAFCDDCCTECEQEIMPEVLYFDIRGSTIAESSPYDPRCLDISDIPLAHTRPLFAEKHRWEGHAIVPCLMPLDSPVGPYQNRIDVVITCNGTLWELTVKLTCENGTSGSTVTIASNNPIWTTSFSCSPVAWVGVLSSDLVSSCCCNGVFEFEFAVSE